MTSILDRVAARLRGRHPTDAIAFRGQMLPAIHLRTGGANFFDNEYYLQSAVAEADRLIQHCGVTSATHLLDVGCGSGRLAIGLLSRLSDMAYYRGIDVDS